MRGNILYTCILHTQYICTLRMTPLYGNTFLIVSILWGESTGGPQYEKCMANMRFSLAVSVIFTWTRGEHIVFARFCWGKYCGAPCKRRHTLKHSPCSAWILNFFNQHLFSPQHLSSQRWHRWTEIAVVYQSISFIHSLTLYSEFVSKKKVSDYIAKNSTFIFLF